MNGSRAKALRNQAQAGALAALETVKPVLVETYGKAQSALGNEKLTRERVEALEAKVTALEGVRARSLRGRLRWLLLGR